MQRRSRVRVTSGACFCTPALAAGYALLTDPSGTGAGSACIDYSMWAGLVISTKSFKKVMVFKSEACGAFHLCK